MNIASEIEKVVKVSFTSAIRYSIRVMDETTLEITLHEPVEEGMIFESYLPTGDKINKIFAEEVVRIFYKLPQIEQIKLYLVANKKVYILDMSRGKIEEYYNIKMEELREFDEEGNIKVGDCWRKKFMEAYGNKESRRKFVEQFVHLEE